ncbi:MAG: hypothetical protein NZ805_11285 [Armatimonadetes bacterium]|nr:hypothetical protein [Armatimonadota bacterium]MDW8029219.1 hypothetical protein [Armatimonadota bacterium]
MEGRPVKMWQRVLLGLWFAVVVGITARLGEDFRSYVALRNESLQLQAELESLDHKINVLQNKLRYLYTPEGVRLVQRLQLVGTSEEEKILVFEEDLFPISLIELLPGGFEEWDEKKFLNRKPNRWLARLSRHWQRLRSERYR